VAPQPPRANNRHRHRRLKWICDSNRKAIHLVLAARIAYRPKRNSTRTIADLTDALRDQSELYRTAYNEGRAYRMKRRNGTRVLPVPRSGSARTTHMTPCAERPGIVGEASQDEGRGAQARQ